MATNDYNACIHSTTPSPPEHGHATSCRPHELEPHKCGCRHNELQSPIWVHAPEQAPSPPAFLLLVLGCIHNGSFMLLTMYGVGNLAEGQLVPSHYLHQTPVTAPVCYRFVTMTTHHTNCSQYINHTARLTASVVK
jgi:hypothetical protein